MLWKDYPDKSVVLILFLLVGHQNTSKRILPPRVQPGNVLGFDKDRLSLVHLGWWWSVTLLVVWALFQATILHTHRLFTTFCGRRLPSRSGGGALVHAIGLAIVILHGGNRSYCWKCSCENSQYPKNARSSTHENISIRMP
jgi:hypothetical protein